MREDERALVDQLLAQPFNGRNEIAAQLAAARVSAEGDRDTRTLGFVPQPAEVAPAPTTLRVPVEGEAEDDDGVPIAVLLHVMDGRVVELEIYRVDGQPIRRKNLPALQSVSVNQ
jgi:hypothetical protein